MPHRIFSHFLPPLAPRKRVMGGCETRMNQPNNPTDDISIALTESGSQIEWAIEQIYERFENWLFAVAFAVLHSQSDAHDAVQEAILALYTKATSGKWNLDGSLFGFLKRIVRNKALDILRERTGYERLGEALEEEQTTKRLIGEVTHEISPGLSKTEGTATFDEFIGSLTPMEKFGAEIIGQHWRNCGEVISVQEMLKQMTEMGLTATRDSIKSLRKRIWRRLNAFNRKAELV
jgi:RNA polymerase sigma factor (sigma-70 family)